jgi:Uma2 family endonuclease
MSTTTSFHSPPPGFPPLVRVTLEQYEAMMALGLFPDRPRIELIEGILVQKVPPNPPHSALVVFCAQVITALLPPDWHVRPEQPVRMPPYGMPHPDIAVTRGAVKDYLRRHPDAGDVAMLVEVSDTTLAGDRAKAATYGGAGVPVYWIVNVQDRQLEVYSNPTAGVYPTPTILRETDSVELIIAGQPMGQIAVAELLP